MSATEDSKDRGRSAKGRAQDDQVMGTNNSSIVSKRSVEKLYYPNEPHFFRYFVKKFQRRAPLINRGYHLRLHVIDVTVRKFLRKDRDGKRKVVINLGCGYDVLPWQTWTRYPGDCKNVKFIDIDFPDLMARKRQTVLSTPELLSPLTNLETPEGKVLLKSDTYAQIGCDLRNLDSLRAAISELVDISESSFLFVAEVSITYMETEAADGIVQWASALGEAEFCLLEQILPDGPEHPFAMTMLSHFDKLSTPLKSVKSYKTLQDQKHRFLSRGWTGVNIWSLWQAWGDGTFLSAEDRRRLDEVEPFDEWEEFALFASHYCLVNAGNYPSFGAQDTLYETDADVIQYKPTWGGLWESWENVSDLQDNTQIYRNLNYSGNPGTKGQRRFGAAIHMQTRMGYRYVANTMGLGPSSRLTSCDIYGLEDNNDMPQFIDRGPHSRMCHTITDLGEAGQLLAGGRTSPANPLKDCWIYNKFANRWERTYDLPFPVYRHSVVRICNSSLALLIGGKTGPSTVSSACLLFDPNKGWIELKVEGDNFEPVFGATFVVGCLSSSRQYGFIAGGMTSDNVIPDQIMEWKFTRDEVPSIHFIAISPAETSAKNRRLMNRFGAVCIPSKLWIQSKCPTQVLIGGIARDKLLSKYEEILLCDFDNVRFFRRTMVRNDSYDWSVPDHRRPLLVGHSVLQMEERDLVVILGGGATCFSMGTYWNKASYTFCNAADEDGGTSRCYKYLRTLEMSPEVQTPTMKDSESSKLSKPKITTIPRVGLQSAEEFEKILRKAQPVVLTGLELGSCLGQWTLDYIVDRVGSERKVVVHESSTAAMDFNAKNFSYVTNTFAEFAKEVQNGSKLYLRALSTDEPADLPANLAADFPSISADFTLPPELAFVKENTFSSVLRISGPVNMWLHYDVMANVYCQIQGSKRLILFPPTDVEHLGFAPGASSSSLDVFSNLDLPSLGRTHPYEAVLSPGDVLFIPPLWLHTASPTSDTSIAVNIFFRDLDNGYSSGRDVYGNRDLAAYEKGRQDINRLVNSFQKLPAQARDFYLLRLAAELRQNIQS